MDDTRSTNVTERVHNVLRFAGDLAGRRDDTAISPSHIALAVIEEGTGVAATALYFEGLELGLLKAEFAAALRTTAPEGLQRSRPDRPHLIAESDQMLEIASVESQSLQRRYLGTEHLLLALLRDQNSAAARILDAKGVRYENVKARILWLLGADPIDPTPFTQPPAV